MASEWYVSTEELSGVVDGAPVTVHKGDLVRGSSAVYKAYKDHFVPAEDKHFTRFDVEQATAEPSEKRGARKASS
jgi:hypothetical protein